MHQADPERLQRRAGAEAPAGAVGVGAAVVVMQVEESPVPAEKQPEREQRDHHAHARLGGRLHARREVCLEDDDRQPEGEQARRVADSPGESEARRRPGGAVATGCDQRRHRSEVVRVGRVAKAEHDGDDDDEPKRRPVREMGKPVVETQHLSSPSGAHAQSWRDRPRG